jgi:trimeric autotransporter adhesin
MASTYINDLRLNEMATGDGSGTWGTTTNTNLELIAEAFSYGTEVITTNADTHTTTIADGATDPGRSLYLKYTGTLDSACTITIGPNTVSKVWIIENGTSGSQNIIISQGSGANITIPAGDTKVVYSDGAGAGAAFFDAFASLSVVDLKVQDDLTVTDDASIGGDATITGTLGVTGNITGTLATAAQTNITSVGTLTGLTVTGTGTFPVQVTGTNTATSVSFDNTHANGWGSNIAFRTGGTDAGYFGTIGSLLGNTDQDLATYATASNGIRFYTNGNNERMRIDSSGNVGIGTSSPIDKLHVAGNSSTRNTIVSNVTLDGGTAVANPYTDFGFGIDFIGLDYGDAVRNYAGIYTIMDSHTSSAGGGDVGFKAGLSFYTNGGGASDTDPTERMRIDSSGNVGIGTSAPSALLNIAHPSHGIALGYEGDTLPATAGMYTSSSTNFGQAYGSLVIQSRTDYAGYSTIFRGNSGEQMRIDSSGNVNIGVSSAISTSANTADGFTFSESGGYAWLSVSDTGGIYVQRQNDNSVFSFYRTTANVGSISVTASATAYNTSSDARLKDVTGEARGLEVINELNPVAYNWKADGKADEGLIAQEVLNIVPNAVSGSEEDMYQMDYSKLVVHLVAGMKEQQTQIDALQSEINKLKGE